MPDWIDQLRADLDIQASEALPSLKSIWGEVSRQPVQPSRQEIVDQWMNTPADQLAALAQQLGPEGYSQLVDDKMKAVEGIFGSATADKLQPYFRQFTPQGNPVQAQYDQMGQMGYGQMGQMGSPAPLDNPEPIDLESEVDKYLESSLLAEESDKGTVRD